MDLRKLNNETLNRLKRIMSDISEKCGKNFGTDLLTWARFLNFCIDS